MGRRARLVVAVLVPFTGVLLTLAACVGDDPPVGQSNTSDASPVREGELGQPCHPNGTCSGDLVCQQGICLQREPTADAGADSSAGDADAGPPRGRSCDGLPSTCGPTDAGDCCATSMVPGGTFKRSYDGVNAAYMDGGYPANVTSFWLDRYEVTVARFRKFVEAYPTSRPSPGMGKNPSDPFDKGWQMTWTGYMPADATALKAALRCVGDPKLESWTDAPDANENKAMNCLTWYEAFAFCIWDGGRLPTEAEWNYAAAGGSEQRAYPWSLDGGNTIDGGYAVYGTSLVAPVGSKSPLGDGRWGHADLAGNVYEWVVDMRGDYPVPCNDCANWTVTTPQGRGQRGGSAFGTANACRSSPRFGNPEQTRDVDFGVRCVRNP